MKFFARLPKHFRIQSDKVELWLREELDLDVITDEEGRIDFEPNLSIHSFYNVPRWLVRRTATLAHLKRQETVVRWKQV